MKLFKPTAILFLLTLIILTGCKKEGKLEKAGDRADEIIDNVKDGDPPLEKKGPLEKAGEAVDDAVNK